VNVKGEGVKGGKPKDEGGRMKDEEKHGRGMRGGKNIRTD